MNAVEEYAQPDIEDLANRFVVYFKPAVLAQYRAESHKFKVELSDFEGKLDLQTNYWEELDETEIKAESVHIRFGFRRHSSGQYFVAVFGPDFKQYSKGHLDRWIPYHVEASEMSPLPDKRFEMWAERNLLGSWSVRLNYLEAIAGEIKLMNSISLEAFGIPLFLHEKNPSLHCPLVENTHAYQDAQKELYGYLVDGLNCNAVAEILRLTGTMSEKSDKFTRQRLQRAFPSNTVLWSALEVIERERRLATHKVRADAEKYAAFESFCNDLEAVQAGLTELRQGMERALGVSGERAEKRQEALKRTPKRGGPPADAALRVVLPLLRHMTGRTVESVDLYQRQSDPEMHESEVVEIEFTDGSVIYLDTGTNAYNVSGDHGDFLPSEFHVSFYPHMVPSPLSPEPKEREHPP